MWLYMFMLAHTKEQHGHYEGRYKYPYECSVLPMILSEWFSILFFVIKNLHLFLQASALLTCTGLSKIIEKSSRLHGTLAEGISRNFLCDTCFDISTFAEEVLTDPDTSANIIDYINGSLCNSLSSFQEEVILSFARYKKASHMLRNCKNYLFVSTR